MIHICYILQYFLNKSCFNNCSEWAKNVNVAKLLNICLNRSLEKTLREGDV